MDRYQRIPVTFSRDGRRHISTTRYPNIEGRESDIYVITTRGDRFDILANQYYKDPTLWWIISIANPQLPQDSYYPPLGVQIRIPQEINSILAEYNELNS